MIKRVYTAKSIRTVALVLHGVSAAVCLLTTGCSTFIFTKTYHDAATEKSVFTPIRAAAVEDAYLQPDGILTVGFSGWNCCRNMQPGTERDYVVRVQTIPGRDAPGVPTVANSTKQQGTLRLVVFDKTHISPPRGMPPDALPLPVHIVSDDSLRRTTWKDFASKQVGPGVWVRTDCLQFLYVPAPENDEAILPLLAQSYGENALTFPLLLYGYPVAVPILVAVDVVTLPIKAVAVLVFFVTWDGSMF